MKKLSLAIITLLCFLYSAAQTTSSYEQDIDELYAILQKLYSFKDQINGDKKTEFEGLYKRLRTDTSGTSDYFQRYYKLVQLFFMIRDNHLSFFKYPPVSLKKAQMDTLAYAERYRQSSFFKNFPSVSINLDSLERALRARHVDSAEGIYYYGSFLKVGLYRIKGTNEFTGVVLQTTLPVWDKGQVAIKLYEYRHNCFHAVYANTESKFLVLYPNEKYRNGTLVNSFFYTTFSDHVYRKDTLLRDYSAIPRNAPQFAFKSINANTQYIRLGTFAAVPSSIMRVSDSFYNSIQNTLTTDHLVVDLRDNSGGAEKVSGKFFKLIRRFAKTKKVYILINNGTMSQGEIFTIQLMSLQNVKVYGQTTKGTIAYGSNYGTVKNLPSGKFGVSITDMKDKEGYVKYESYGIEPQVVFQNDGDWIEKILQVISQDK
jgi:Peptidase family S41